MLRDYCGLAPENVWTLEPFFCADNVRSTHRARERVRRARPVRLGAADSQGVQSRSTRMSEVPQRDAHTRADQRSACRAAHPRALGTPAARGDRALGLLAETYAHALPGARPGLILFVQTEGELRGTWPTSTRTRTCLPPTGHSVRSPEGTRSYCRTGRNARAGRRSYATPRGGQSSWYWCSWCQ